MDKCVVSGCAKRLKTKKYCTAHYEQLRVKGTISPEVRSYEKHGATNTVEYHCWVSMKNRCYIPTHPRFKDWGGRGIKVCGHWRNSYVKFIFDLGLKPSPELSLDRIDNNMHYSCGHCDECVGNGWTLNCRWATVKEQAVNRRNTKTISDTTSS